MIRLVWTKNNLVLSKLIRWAFAEPVSHFAMCFDDRLVFHSSLTGAEPVWARRFLATHDIVFTLMLRVPPEIEDKIYDRIYAQFWRSRPYDWGAFFYFFVTGLAHKVFGRPMPTRNLWGDRDSYLCIEIAEVLRPAIDLPDELDMLTPMALYKLIQAQLGTNPFLKL